MEMVSIYMNSYSVAPNQDASRWIVKLEEVASTNSYTPKDDTISAAEELTKNNSPSKVKVLAENYNSH